MTADRYTVGEKLGETEQFRLYRCELAEGKLGILKISTDVAFNGILDREAYILQTLRDEAICCEEAFAKENPGTKEVLNYQICFPDLVESFIAEDQGGRRINILSFTHVSDDLSRLVPIGQITSPLRLHSRVDPKTSAWMLGKGLKLLVFAHSQGISIGQVTDENFLVEFDQHYVAFFDWSKAKLNSENELPPEVTASEISQLAKLVILVLGGDLETGKLPIDDQLTDDRYERYLHSLASGCESDASKAHAEFYRIVRLLWPKTGHKKDDFWPFTSYNLERI